MKTTQTLPVPAQICRFRVNKLLMKGVIHLTSKKFLIFATATGTLLTWIGACSERPHVTAIGASLFIAGFLPWSIREVAREIRRDGATR